MRLRRNLIPAIALAVVTTSAARAGEPSPEYAEPWRRWLALEGQLGLGMPTGWAGVAVDVTPHPLVSINIGLGNGFNGTQVAAMARIRALFINDSFALGIGGGVSRGDTISSEPYGEPIISFTQATWLNGEVFSELRIEHFHLRPFLGVARRIAYAHCEYYQGEAGTGPCPVGTPDFERNDTFRTIAYTGIAIGFGLF